MPFIPRQVKPPARIAITCKLPQQVATLLKCYAEFLDSSQDYVVTEIVQLACRKDREFQAWLATTHPDLTGELTGSAAPLDLPVSTASGADPRPSRRSPRLTAPGRLEP